MSAAAGGGRRIDVSFSPPTPNGDLHLGHLSGPVLAADVCARSQKMLGNDVAFASSTDDNQTYVVTTAERVGTSPEELIRSALHSVTETLALGGVDVDLFARPDADYETFVRDFFTGLHRAGAFDRRVVELPYDPDTGEYRAEAFVTGRCPECLAHARAGVCETCGLYNLPAALLPTGDGPDLPRREVSIWVLDLERHRALLEQHHADPERVQRPDLRRVVDVSLDRPLPYIPVTYPSRWGIAVDWDGDGAEPQAINAWPEIYVGHLFWLRRARAGRRTDRDELVQFIGIDNGFYNAFVYPALSMLGVRAGLDVDLPPARTVTNQYYLLEGRKFSTSKGDVLWAGDYLRSAGRDRARFVLAVTSPELQRSEFTEPVAESTLQRRFDEPLAAIASGSAALVGRSADHAPSAWWASALSASRRRFLEAYDLDRFSIRGAAEALALHLEVLATGLADHVRDDADVSGALHFLWALSTLAWPVTPDLAAAVARAFGRDEPAVPLVRDLTRPDLGTFRGFTLPGRAAGTQDLLATART